MPMDNKLTRFIMPYDWKNAIVDNDYSDLKVDEIKELNLFLFENNILFSDCHCHTKIPYPSYFGCRICMVLEYYYKTIDR